ncbi:hypothetical protein K450DRAFT_243966 [Umbelopsis ramanniana AG]|uniref:Uncharacterized protein n=1 Tax=Umbelopsis ramanniana AG TaxID=1314678 RepID=A0AAD5EA06_UMBRA|nr:uncharacterized protein K450DRAFT_243966 [Umbelopsis ramanniana AG]KAI8579116.1 hypothetical protein K450DRAFT_243966 [Umbelopsis ramanniana AG]
MYNREVLHITPIPNINLQLLFFSNFFVLLLLLFWVPAIQLLRSWGRLANVNKGQISTVGGTGGPRKSARATRPTSIQGELDVLSDGCQCECISCRTEVGEMTWLGGAVNKVYITLLLYKVDSEELAMAFHHAANNEFQLELDFVGLVTCNHLLSDRACRLSKPSG